MQIAGVDMYVNHPVLHLGATDWVPHTLSLGETAAVSCDTHVAVRVQAQTCLIKVRFFRESPEPEAADPAFTTVFDGSLLLSDGRMAIGDIEGLTGFVRLLGDRGEWSVRVAVDSPGWEARAIDITVARRGS